MRKIKAIIWDLDGTLYKFHDAFDKTCEMAAAKAAVQLGFKGSLEAAAILANRCFGERNNGLEVFTEEHGISMNQLHEVYHEHISIDDFKPCDDLIAEIQKIDCINIILTHGSTNWAYRVLSQIGLISYFNQSNIVGMEQYQFNKKHESEVPFKMVIEKIGVKAEECLVVEDNIINLQIPHDLGMMTALVNKTTDKPTLFTDYIFEEPVLMLKSLRELNYLKSTC